MNQFSHHEMARNSSQHPASRACSVYLFDCRMMDSLEAVSGLEAISQIFPGQDHEGGELQESKEVFEMTLIAGDDTTVVLQPCEHRYRGSTRAACVGPCILIGSWLALLWGETFALVTANIVLEWLRGSGID